MRKGRLLHASLVFAAMLCALFALSGTASAAQEGVLQQLADPSGCVRDSSAADATCGSADNLYRPGAVAISPDGKNAYSATTHGYNGTLNVFTRDPDGSLQPYDDPGTAVNDGCFSYFGWGRSGCQDVRGSIDPSSIVISPDGKFVYVGSWNYGSIAIFSRDAATGALTQLPGTDGCLANWGDSSCAPLSDVGNVSDIELSPDGKTLYAVGHNSYALTSFSRNAVTGTLTQLTGPGFCASYNGSGGACLDARGIDGPERIALSPDGANVYVTGADAGGIATFQRVTSGPDTGKLSQVADEDGCIRNDGGDHCFDGHGFGYMRGIVVSPDGENVYATTDQGLVVLRRDTTTGALWQSDHRSGCWYYGDNNDCKRQFGLSTASGLALSPDGQTLYVGSSYPDAVMEFERRDGKLRPIAGPDSCWSQFPQLYGNNDYDSYGVCSQGHAMQQDFGAQQITIDPLGQNVYVGAAESNAVDVFSRVPAASGNDRLTWDLSEDRRYGAKAENPQRDRYGNANVWQFAGFDTADPDAADRDPAQYDLLTAHDSNSGDQDYDRWFDGSDGYLPFLEGADASMSFIHPQNPAGGGDNVGIYGWRNPLGTSATVNLAGMVNPTTRYAGNGITWFLDNGSTNLRGGTIDSSGGYQPAAHFEVSNVTVPAGGTVWLGVASHGDESYDWTETELRVTGPVAGTLSTGLAAGAPRDLINDSTPTFDLTSNLSTATYQCRVFAPDTTPGAFANCADPYTSPTLTDGDYVFEARAKDPVTSAVDQTPLRREFTVDATPPVVTVNGPSGTTRQTTSTFTFTSSEPAHARFYCSLDSAPFTRCDSPVQTPELSDGAHTFRVKARDAAGNDSAIVTKSFTVVSGPNGLQPGALAQLPGAKGCIAGTASIYGGATCSTTTSNVTSGLNGSVVSPDGKFLYATAQDNNTLLVFDRNTTDGSLTQKAAPNGCFYRFFSGNPDCQDNTTGIYAPTSLALSPDGKFLYVAGYYDAAVTVFSRDAVTGNLTPLAGANACIAQNPGLPCTQGRALRGTRDLVVTDNQVYAVGDQTNSVAILDRAADGSLTQDPTQNGCYSDSGTDGDGGPCRNARGMSGAWGVEVSPDGKNVYVTAQSTGGVVTFSRDLATGDLSQLGGEDGCITENGGEDCFDGRLLYGARGLAVSPDGNNVYVATGDGLAVLDRDASGALSQDSGPDGCLSRSFGDNCRHGVAVDDEGGAVAVSPDGQSVYLNSYYWDDAVAVLRRDADGNVRQLTGADGCWADDGRGGECRDGKALRGGDGNAAISLSPDGKSLYLAAYDYPGALAVFQRGIPTAADQPQPYEWDAARDFVLADPGANPAPDQYGNAGVWRYQKADADGEGTNLDTATYTDLDSFVAGRNGWWNKSWHDSTSATSWLGEGVGYYSNSADRFLMHPEDASAGGESIVLKFTDPLAGTNHFEVSGLIEDVENCGGGGDGVTWHILRNGSTQLDTGTVLENARAQTSDLSLDLDAGDVLTFAVSPRANFGCDKTVFDVHITGPTQPGPQTVITAGPRVVTNDDTPAFSFSGAGAFECKVDGGSFAACTSGASLAHLADGAHTFSVRAKNGSALDPTPAVRTFTVDTQAPTLTVTDGPGGNSVTRDPDPTFTFTSTEPGVRECRVDGGAWSACASPFTTPELADGTHTVDLRAYDRAKNQSPTVTRTFRVDTGAGSLQDGALAQLPGTRGCISLPSTLGDGSTCAAAPGLDGPLNGAFDPSGTFLYTAARNTGSVRAYQRTPSGSPGAGQLTPVPGAAGCYTNDGSGGACTAVRGLQDATQVATYASSVYVLSYNNSSVAVLHRNNDGSLDQPAGDKGCVANNGGGNFATCAQDTDISNPTSIAVSPDGKFVYVTNWGSSIVSAFQRDASDGSLTKVPGPNGCYSDSGANGCADGRALNGPQDVVVSPDGKNLYVASYWSGAVASFSIDPVTGAITQLAADLGCASRDGGENCVAARQISYATALAISPDGDNVYVSGQNYYTVTTLNREADGGLSQPAGFGACIDQNGGSYGCADGTALHNPSSITVSPDGRNVYVEAYDSDAVDSFTRSDDGTLVQLSGLDACYSDSGNDPGERAGACRDGKALQDAGAGHGLTLSPDGENLYAFSEDSDAIAVFARRKPQAAAQPQNQVWDAAQDFDNTAPGSNPTPDRYGNAGVWRYRTAPDNDGSGTGRNPASYVDLASFGNSGDRNGWYESGLNAPYIAKVDSGWLDSHPGQQPGLHPVILEWKNPLTTTQDVNVTGALEDYNPNCGDGISWYLDKNGTELQSGTIPNGAPVAGFDLPVTVSPGDSLFLSYYPRGGWDCDGTRLNLTVNGPQETGPQTQIVSGPKTTTADNTPSFTFAGGPSYECRIDGGAFTACTTPFTATTLSDGQHTLRVRSKNGAVVDGSPAKRTFTVDTTPPVLSIDSGPDGLIHDRTPTWSLSRTPADAGSRFDCRVDGGAWSRCTSPFTTPQLADGSHTVDFRAVDRWDNTSPVQTVSLQLDTSTGGIQFGALTQLQGAAGCVARSQIDCGTGRGLDGTAAVVVTPDNKFVYGGSVEDNAITAFARNADGSLTQLAGAAGCYRGNSTADGCTSVRALSNVYSLAITPDGKYLYAAAYNNAAVVAFSIGADGSLTQLADAAGCIRDNSTSENCASAHRLGNPYSIRISPDGAFLYAVSGSQDIVAALAIAPDGSLSEDPGVAGCVRDVSWSDSGCRSARMLDNPTDIAFAGTNAYVTGFYSDSVAVLDRGADGGLTQKSGADGCVRWAANGDNSCTKARAIADPYAIVASPDGQELYVADQNEDSVAILDRAADGRLSQANNVTGCWSNNAASTWGGPCSQARGLYNATGLTLSADGKSLYVVSQYDDAVAVFRRSKTAGTTHGDLQQLSAQDGCWSQTGNNGDCHDGKALDHEDGQGIAVSPDGASVYAASRNSDAIAVFARRIPRADNLPPVPEWDAREDFNTAGVSADSADRFGNAAVWSYLRGNGNPDGSGRNRAGYTKFTDFYTDGNWQELWRGSAGDGSFPYVGLTQTHGIQVHPRSDTPAVIRWTYPGTENNTSEVSVLLSDLSPSCGDGVRWFLDQNGNPIAQGTTLNGGPATGAERSVSLTPGDVLELVVTSRSSNMDCDATGVGFHIGADPVVDTGFTDDSPSGRTNDDTPTFHATSSEDNATFQCRYYPLPAPATLPPFTTCAQDFTLPHLADGEYRVEARTFTPAVDQTPAFRVIEVDATAPAPTITAPPHDVNSKTPSFSGTAGDATDTPATARDKDTITVRIYDSSNTLIRTLTSTRTGTSWTATFSGAALDEGSYTAKASQDDEAGNTGTSAPYAFKVDVTPPVVGVTDPPAPVNCTTQAPAFHDRTPVLTGTAGTADGTAPAISADSATINIKVWSGSSPSGTPIRDFTTTRTGGTYSGEVPGPDLAEGTYSMRAEQKDAANNNGVSPSRCFKIDVTAPTVTLTMPSPGSPDTTNDRTPDFQGQGGNATGSDPNETPDDLTVTLKVYSGTDTSPTGTVVQSKTVSRGSLGEFADSLSTNLPDGTYTAVAEQGDKAGNVGRSNGETFKVDRTGPVISVTTPPLRNGKPDTADSTPTISGIAGHKTGAELDAVADNGTVDIDVYAGTATSGATAAIMHGVTRDALGAYTADVPSALTDGTYTAVVRQDDALSNHTDQSYTFKVDTLAPNTLTIDAPTENFETKQSRPAFSGQAAIEDFTNPAISEDLQPISVEIYDGTTISGTPGHTATGTRDAATSNWTASLPVGDSLPDGRYVARAVQYDNAGNVKYSADRHFKVDNTPPHPTIATAGGRTDWDETLVSLNGVAGTNGATDVQSADLVPITVKVSSGATVVQTKTVNRDLVTGAYSVTLDALPEGTYTASAEQSDGAGNTGASLTPVTFKVDKTDPNPSVTVPSEKQAFAIQNPVFSGGKGDNSGTAATQSQDSDTVSLHVTAAGGFDRQWTDTEDGSSWSSAVPAPALPEGYYTLNLTQADAAGNSLTTADRHFKIDLTAPTATIADPGDDIKTPPTFSGTGATNPGTNADSQSADDSSVTVKLYKISGTSTRGQAITFTPSVTAGGTWSVASGLASNGTDDGRYEVEVTQKDAVGNTRTSSPQAFRLDTIAPQITLTNPSGDTNDQSPHLVGTAGTNTGGATDDTSADDNHITVTVTRPSTGATPVDHQQLTIDNTGSFDLAIPSTLPEGTYQVTIAQVDGAGNNSAATPKTFRVDITQPSGLTTAQPSGDTNQVRPTFSGAAGNQAADESHSLDGDVKVEVLDNASTVIRTFTVTRSGATYSGALQGADLPEGTYTWRATQKDAAGNSVTTAERSFRVDTTVPAPTMTPITGYTSDNTPDLTGTRGSAFHDNTPITVTLTGPGTTQVLHDNGAGATWTVTPTALVDGTWTATVAQADQAGNQSAVTSTFKVDATAPTVTTAAIAPSQNAPTISGTAGANTATASHAADDQELNLHVTGVTAGLSDPGDIVAQRDAVFPTAWSVVYPSTLPQGRYRVVASQGDGAVPSNIGTASPQDFVVDRTAPAPAITAPAAGSRHDRTFHVQATLGAVNDADHAADDTKADIRIYDGLTTTGTPVASYTNVAADPSHVIDQAVVIPAGPDGQYTIVVDQADAAGNHGTDSRVVKVDATAPVVSITAPAEDQHVQAKRPTFSGAKGTVADGTATSADLDTIRVKVYDNAGLTGTPKVFTTSSSTGTWSVQADQDLAEGFYWAVAEQDDAAGNTGTSSVRHFRVDLTDPQPSIVSPANNAYTNDTTPDVTISRGTDVGDLADVTVTFVQGGTTITKHATGTATTVTADTLAEGDWTITASQSDQSGRTGSSAPVTLHVDTTNPAPTIDTITSPAKNVTAVSGTAGTAAGDAGTVHVKVSGTTIDQNVPVSGGTWSVNLPQPVSEGAHTVDVTQSDAAGNQGSASRSFTIDRTAPAPTATDPSGDITNQQPTLQGTAGTASGDDNTVTVHLARVGGSTTDFTGVAVTAGAWQKAITSNLADGRYDITVTQGDAAGNTATSAAHRFRVDTAAPVVVLDNVPAVTGSAQPTFTGTAGGADGTGDPSQDLAVHVLVYAGATATGSPVQDKTATRNGVNGYSAQASSLSDGTYTVKVTQSDNAGNAGASAPQTFRVDTTAPAVTLDAVTSPTNNNQPTFTGTLGQAAGDGADVTVTLNGPNNATRTLDAVETGGTWSATPATALADGAWTAVANQDDSAGNHGHSGQRAFTVDTVAPTLAVTGPADGSYSKTGRPTVSGTSDDAADVHITLTKGGTTVPLTATPSGGTWSATVAQADTLADGDWTIHVTQTDAAGNTATATDRTLHVDSVAPAVTVDALAARTGDSTPDFAGDRGTAPGDDGTVNLSLSGPNNEVRLPVAVNNGGRWSYTPATPLADGTWTITATQTDAAGNTTTTAPRTFTVDTAKPNVSVVSPADGAWTNDNTPDVTIARGTATGDLADVTVTITDGTTTVTKHATGSATTVTSDQLADGDWTITASQTDDVGNTRTTAPRTLHVDTVKPTVSVTSPPARTGDATPTIAGQRSHGTGDSDLTVTVKKGATVVDTKTIPVGSSPDWSFDEASLTDGDYTVSASEVDLAGNVSDVATKAFTVDTAAPNVGIASPADGTFTKDDTPDVTITRGTATGDLADVTVTFTKGQTTIVKHATGTQTTVTADQLAEGDWTITADQSDDVGNTGHAGPRTLHVDTTAPSPAITAPADGTRTNDTTPAISGTAGHAAGDDAQVHVTLTPASGPDVTFNAPVANDGTWSGSPAALAEGGYTVTVSQGDAAGNSATSAGRSLVIDTTAPSVTLDTVPARTGDSTPAFAGDRGTAAGDGTDVTVTLDGPGGAHRTLQATVNGGRWSATPDTALGDGDWTASATQTDQADNARTTATQSFTVDTASPDVALLTPADGAFTKDTTPTVTITRGTAAGDQPDVTVTLTKGAKTVTVTIGAGTTSADVPAADALAEGDWTVTAAQSDDVGNTKTTTPRTLHVDTTAPAPAVTAPADNAVLSDQTPTISGTAGNAAGDDNTVHVTISRTGTADVKLDAPVSGTAWTVDAPTLPAGAYSVTVGQGDAAGNSGTSAARSFRIKPTGPSVAITAPAGGAQTTDTTPTIAGTAGNDADDAATVTVKVFSGSAATGSPVQTLTATRSGTAWTVDSTPDLALGTYTVQAEQSDAAGHTGTSAPVTFAVVATPPPALTLSAVTVPPAPKFAKTGTFTVTAKVSAPSTVKGDLFLSAKLAKKAKIKGKTVTVKGQKVVLIGTSKPVSATDTASLKVKVAKKTLKALRKLKKAKLLLRITATGSAGQTATSYKTVTYDLKKGIKA